MPWIDVLTPCTPSAESQKSITAGLASILMETIQKEERKLMVTFRGAQGFYQGREPTDMSAVVDVRYVGTFAADKKREITRRICALLEKVLHVDPQKVYIPFSELASENWGRRGGDYT
jgi:phenylpyruvate tautomerase PptA (4-oxalocrotonate tautomerase family)